MHVQKSYNNENFVPFSSNAYNNSQANPFEEMSDLLTKSGSHRVRKVNDFEFRIEKDPSKGMKVPVTIYATDNLISKMVADRTVDQAANVSTLPGVRKHVVVLPDGHEGYGFPVRGVAALDLEEGVISPG